MKSLQKDHSMASRRTLRQCVYISSKLQNNKQNKDSLHTYSMELHLAYLQKETGKKLQTSGIFYVFWI